MTQKSFRPATLRGSVQAENINIAWQLSDVLNSKSTHYIQESQISNFTIDSQLNVIRVKFASHLREVQP